MRRIAVQRRLAVQRSSVREPASAVVRRMDLGALVVGIGVGVATWTARGDAWACGACDTPRLLDVGMAGNELVVVTNFGLLTRTKRGWQLTCEEAIGGLLLDVHPGGSTIASTDSGLFTRSGNWCSWEPGPFSPRNEWALSLTPATVAPDGSEYIFALRIDRDTQSILLERSVDGQDFTVMRRFESTSGYRQLLIGGDPLTVVLGGYTYQPRSFNVALSRDLGESWFDTSPELDNETLQVTLQLVEPASDSVLLRAQPADQSGDRLLRWAVDSTRVEQLGLLSGEELIGTSRDGQTTWLATNSESAGSLYKLDAEETRLSRVTGEGPPFDCLGVFDGVLYACVNDFSGASEFLVAASHDGGKTWEPLLRTPDLVELKSCDESCQRSLDWLRDSLAPANLDGGTPNDADAQPPEMPRSGGIQSVESSTQSSRGSAGCALAPGQHDLGVAVWGLAAAGLLGLRRRRRTAVPARFGVAYLVAGVVSCVAENDPERSDSADASSRDGCNGRGDRLSALVLTTEDDYTLKVLSVMPKPPIVGDNELIVELQGSTGKALAGSAETLLVEPWMPDHGHGTPVTVRVSELERGRYRLAPINTFMPGLWSLKIWRDASKATVPFEILVCVE